MFPETCLLFPNVGSGCKGDQSECTKNSFGNLSLIRCLHTAIFFSPQSCAQPDVALGIEIAGEKDAKGGEATTEAAATTAAECAGAVPLPAAGRDARATGQTSDRSARYDVKPVKSPLRRTDCSATQPY